MSWRKRLEKRKKLVLIGVTVLFAGSLVASMLYSLKDVLTTKTGYKVEEVPKEVLPEDQWKTVMESRIRELEEGQRRLQKSIEELIKTLKETPREVERREEKKEEKTVLPPIEIKIKEPAGPQSPTPPPEVKLPPPPPPPAVPASPQEKPKPPTIREFVPEKTEAKKTKEKKKPQKPKVFVPTGFAKAVLLNGVDAPTLAYGRENPHPVLMLLLDRVVVPNDRKLDLKGCFVLGSAYGELSSERAYVKVSRVSCIDRKGKVYQTKVKGVVLDADGKTGLKGRVVSKFGSVLAKQFVAGILEGIARVLQATYTTVQISPIGTTATVNPEDVTRVSIASGFGSAARRLADFYMDLAKEYFPVIEVQAGRPVTVLFYGGEELEEGPDFTPALGLSLHGGENR